MNEEERLKRLDSMDADALRAIAASMPIIEQAKGIVMGCYGVDADTAFAVLSRLSSSSNKKLRLIAIEVVEATSSPNGSVGEPRPTACKQVRSLIDGVPTSRRSTT